MAKITNVIQTTPQLLGVTRGVNRGDADETARSVGYEVATD